MVKMLKSIVPISLSLDTVLFPAPPTPITRIFGFNESSVSIGSISISSDFF